MSNKNLNAPHLRKFPQSTAFFSVIFHNENGKAIRFLAQSRKAAMYFVFLNFMLKMVNFIMSSLSFYNIFSELMKHFEYFSRREPVNKTSLTCRCDPSHRTYCVQSGSRPSALLHKLVFHMLF